ncbi:BRCT domain-containing protein [Xylogone sp. PMI_703]|nr:BRCT domain-containing protein [Xylogone sp. PMI_703]
MAAVNADNGHDEGSTSGAFDPSSPLKGLIICCTSVPDEKRVEITSMAAQMGAVHRFDLTGDVTHLIVGHYDTPKYRFVAKNRPDVTPMKIDWIEAIRELWIADKEIDIEALERKYTLPTLHSLRFSMTGCDDPVERQSIAEKIKAHGADYEGDLTKRITHLISFRTEGAKYKAARTWGLNIVSIEWLNDSLERGMILDEKLYDPAISEDQRGKDAWDRSKPRRTSLGKRSREDMSTSFEDGKRKLRRTASTKLNSQNEGIWGDIVGAGPAIQVSRSMVWERPERESVRRSESIEKPKRPSTLRNIQPTDDIEAVPQGIFARCSFYVFGFTPARTQVLRDHLVPHDGEVLDSPDGLIKASKKDAITRLFAIIPHNLPQSKYPSLPSIDKPVQWITEWWVERCLHHKRFLDPLDHVVGRPFPIFPIETFKDMIISTSGFSGIDLRHVKEASQLLGATYSEDFTPKSSVLVAKNEQGLRKDKSDHARQWKVPIVTSSWLWDSITQGIRLELQGYRLGDYSIKADISNQEKPRPESKDSNRKEEMSGTKTVSKTIESAAQPRSHSYSPKPEPTDTATFTSIDTLIINRDEEEEDQKEEPGTESPPTAENPLATDELSNKSEPLSEIQSNSPKRPTPKPETLPKIPPQDIENAISNLLAKTKTISAHDTPEENRRRGGKRILGRATSNVSTGSTSLSRATSVDSTATHGNAVEWNSLSGQIKFQGADGDRGPSATENEEENQPPLTQIQYDDPDSKEFKERVMARMRGEKVDTKKREKAMTIGDVAEWSKASGARRSARDRTGRERVGYR